MQVIQIYNVSQWQISQKNISITFSTLILFIIFKFNNDLFYFIVLFN